VLSTYSARWVSVSTLRPLCRSLEKDFRIIAIGVNWRTARMLESKLSGSAPGSHIEARALDSWLAVSKAGGRFCDSRTLLLVDEASQIGIKAQHALLTEVERSGGCILYLGDRAQSLAVSAGSGIELVARTIEAAEISKVVRQSDPQLRTMVEQLAKGDVASAISTMADRDWIIEANGQAATIKTAVDNFFTQRAASPEASHLLICKSNATRLALDAEVRCRMRAEGALTGEDVAINAITPSGVRIACRWPKAIKFASVSVAILPITA
jgi:hypothetical protein